MCKQGADEWGCNYSAFHLETQSNPLPILSGYWALILLQKQMNVASMHTKSISDVAYVTGRRRCQHLSLSGLHSYISRGVHVRLHHWTQYMFVFFGFFFLEGCAVTTYLQWRFKTKVNSTVTYSFAHEAIVEWQANELEGSLLDEVGVEDSHLCRLPRHRLSHRLPKAICAPLKSKKMEDSRKRSVCVW